MAFGCILSMSVILALGIHSCGSAVRRRGRDFRAALHPHDADDAYRLGAFLAQGFLWSGPPCVPIFAAIPRPCGDKRHAHKSKDGVQGFHSH